MKFKLCLNNHVQNILISPIQNNWNYNFKATCTAFCMKPANFIVFKVIACNSANKTIYNFHWDRKTLARIFLGKFLLG